MDSIPTVGNVGTVLSLEFVCSLPDDLGDFGRTFPSRTKLVGSWVFGVLIDSVQHPVSNLEFHNSDVLVVVPCYSLVVGCSPETSHGFQLINGVEVVVKLLPVGILIKPLVPKGWDPCFNRYDSFCALCQGEWSLTSQCPSGGAIRRE